ncbi:MAG: putative transcriptional regulator [Candidatus Azotimanducaceae bacterium]
MDDFTSLSGQFLVSMPSMQGDYFAQSVTLLIEHNKSGAFGLVINKPLNADLKELLADHDIKCAADVTLLESGPVEQDRLFFIHSSDATFEGSVKVNDQLTLSTSLDLVDAMSSGSGPNQIIAGLGYAGWSAGQLESEIQADVWLVTPYNHRIMFDIPFEARPIEAANTIGVDLNLISPTPGHG